MAHGGMGRSASQRVAQMGFNCQRIFAWANRAPR